MRARAGFGIAVVAALLSLQCGESDERGSTFPSGTGGNATGGTAGTPPIPVGGTTSSGGSGASTGTGGSGGNIDAGGGAAGTAGAAGAAAGAAGAAGVPAQVPCTTAAECDDGLFCTGVESCEGGFCQPGTPPLNCVDDGYACTAEVCSESTRQCETVQSDTACQDGSFCNGVESCDPTAPGADPTTGCIAGTAINCDDGYTCTDDSCDEQTKACKNVANDSACSNQTFCDGDEVCDPPTGNPTTGCRAGTPRTCDDGLSCTTDTCDEANRRCLNSPSHAACQDGKYCNGQEQCNPASGAAPTGCVAGSAVVCTSDSVACTVESCDETKQSFNPAQACVTTYDHSQCGSGQQCTASGCVTSQPCSTPTECDDGNACNGTESCDLSIGRCVYGPPKSCDDGIACTLDQCVAPGTCQNTPIDAYCDDQNVCNGSETCSIAARGCQPGVTLNCDDGVPCTFDSCTPGSGCTSQPQDAACDDGNVCNGVETCTASGCQSTGSQSCSSDGIDCTVEQCNPVTGQCESVPDDSKCACGEVCSPTQGGCGKFCTPATCQGKTYQCGDCLDNDGDCATDAADTDCLGACQNNETGYYGDIPGQNNAPCKADCYFDQDSGSGNDDCYWSHECDPLAVAPNYPPEGSKCQYNPNASIPGSGMSCAQAQQTQSQACLSYCGPLTPNGCDCFGCCVFPGTQTAVWLGAVDSSGAGTCDLDHVNDPALCPPCTQVSACLNTCEECEICVGKPTLPASCGGQQQCPTGIQACGLPGQDPCSAGFYCVTGCCQKTAGG